MFALWCNCSSLSTQMAKLGTPANAGRGVGDAANAAAQVADYNGSHPEGRGEATELSGECLVSSGATAAPGAPAPQQAMRLPPGECRVGTLKGAQQRMGQIGATTAMTWCVILFSIE